MSSILSAISENKIGFCDLPDTIISQNSVVVKILISGISSGTEKNILTKKTPSFRRHWDNELRLYTKNGSLKKYPVYLGYESVGEVVTVGKNVSHIKVGDLIWTDSPHSQSVTIEESAALNGLLPKDMDPQIAIFLPLTRVALGAVHDAKIKIGDNVVIFGQGVLGILCAQLAKLSGANVIGVEINKHRITYSSKLGISVLNSTYKDIGLQLRTIFPNGADIAIEASGSNEGIKQSIRSCGINGKVVTVGSYPTESHSINFGEEWHKNRITMISSMTINGCPHPDYPLWNLQRMNKTAIDILHQKKIQVLPLISHTFPFHKAEKAYTLLLQPDSKTMKMVLTYDKK